MSRGLLRNTSVLAAFTGLSRVLGLVRDQAFVAMFGAGGSPLGDAYLTAYRIPNLFRDLFAEGALSAAFVTTFAATSETEGREPAWALANRVITVLFLLVGGLVIAGILFAPYLVALIAPGFESIPDKAALTTRLTRLLWPFLLMLSLAAVWMGMLNSFDRFAVPAAAPVMFNVGSLTIGVPLAFWFDPGLGSRAIMGFAVGTLVGGGLQWLIQVPALRREGFRLRPRFDLRDEGLRRILRLMGPAIVGVAAVQVNVTVNTRFASTMGNGPVAWLYAAFRLVQLPIGVFGVAVSTAVLPTLSRAAARNDLDAFRESLARALRLVALLCLPSAAGLAILAQPLVAVLFEHGRFASTDTIQTARAIRFYAIGLGGYAAIKVLAPALYALGDARRPALISLSSIGVNFLMSWTLTQRLGIGHVGLALSVATVATANFLLLMWAVRHHVGPFGGKELLHDLGKALIACGAMSVVCGVIVLAFANLLGASFLVQLATLAAAIPSSVLAFWAACSLLGIAEVREITERIRIRLQPR